jgi:hypothetical protein
MKAREALWPCSNLWSNRRWLLSQLNDRSPFHPPLAAITPMMSIFRRTAARNGGMVLTIEAMGNKVEGEGTQVRTPDQR